MLHATLSQELTLDATARRCDWTCRSRDKSDIEVKKIGLELIVRADGHKRTLLLPPPWTTTVRPVPRLPTAPWT